MDRILDTDSKPASGLLVKKVGKNIADIGVPRADGFHVDNNAVKKFGPLLQETELTQLVVLLDAEAVKSGLLDGAHLMPSFLKRSFNASSV